ncbi:DUF4365 domain-containing protein [Actinomadura scrupuli]|uniref:DUF4365 domain-containing protein n=1 Tax=Actinomadura scrupuli TaxID=559629 RepID=UPI003D97914A
MLDPDLAGEAAVAIVNKQVLMSLRWFYRSQQVLDYGIDGQVEIKDDGLPTGRLLALQVKGGPSFFSRPNANGWTFVPKTKHVRYWLKHALPVIVVIVDLDEEIAYWEHVNSQTVRSTGKGFAITVPREQTIVTAQDAWLDIAKDMGMRASERYRKNLEFLPPSAVENIEKSWEISPAATAWLALFLAEGRVNPGLTVETLLAGEPSWLQEAGSYGWSAIGAYASEHNLNRAAADAFERASELNPERKGRLLALAGLQLAEEDRQRARTLFDRAQPLPGGDLLARIGAILVGHPAGSAHPFTLPDDLDFSTEESQKEAAAQGLLAIQFQRQHRYDKCTERLLKAHSLRPDASTYMLALSDAYVKQALQNGDNPGHLVHAFDWANRALIQRRKWDGGTIEALSDVLSVLMLQSDYEKVVQLGSPEPYGEALPHEFRDRKIAYTVLGAAKLLNRESVISDLLDALEDQEYRERLKLEFSGNPTKEQSIQLAREHLRESQEANMYDLLISSVMRLASLGEDYVSALDSLIEQGITSDTNRALAAAILTAYRSLDEALPKLRSLADREVAAAHHLIILLVNASRLEEAEVACRRAYDRLRDPDFLAQRFEILVQLGHNEKAESVGQEVIAESAIIGIQRARAYRYFAQQAASREDWGSVERYLTSALAAVPDVSDRWNLIRAQLNQRRDQRAAEVILEFQLIPRDISEAKIWLRVMISRPWDDHLVAQGLALASRFEEDNEFSGAVLLHIISTTRSVEDKSNDEDSGIDELSADARSVVQSDLRRKAFAALNAYADLHADSTIIQRLNLSPEQLIEHFYQEFSNRDYGLIRELIRKVGLGAMPLGMLALAGNKSYALTILERAVGVQVAVAFDGGVHTAEMSAALSALEGPVVIEASALCMISSIASIGDIFGHFSDLLLPASSRDDVTIAAVRARGLTGSAGTIGWDERERRLVSREASAQDQARLLERSEDLDEVARNATVRSIHSLSLFERFNDILAARPWLDPIELAHRENTPLWSDDVALRALAHSVGVKSFSTAALHEALVNRRIERAEGALAETEIASAIYDQQLLMRDFLAEHVVDIPVDLEDLLVQAETDGWMPAGAAAAQLSRASWWAWREYPLKELAVIYAKVALEQAELLPAWQVSAMAGAADKWLDSPAAASTMLAVVALAGFEQQSNVSVARLGLVRARELAELLEIPDPQTFVPNAAMILGQMAYLEDVENFVADVLREE